MSLAVSHHKRHLFSFLILQPKDSPSSLAREILNHRSPKHTVFPWVHSAIQTPFILQVCPAHTLLARPGAGCGHGRSGVGMERQADAERQGGESWVEITEWGDKGEREGGEKE